MGLAFATASAERAPTDVGDEENSQGWLFSDASHRERSEPGEISTFVEIMEQLSTIPCADGKEIYAVHHRQKTGANTVLILVHGLTGSMNQYIHLILARSIEKHGIDVIRFNQYGEELSARKFHQTTISQHVADTRMVIDYARSQGYTSIYVAGHSLGAPVAIAAFEKDLRGLILLDPTFTPRERVVKWENRDPQCSVPFLELGFRVILGESWLRDAKEFPDSYQQFASINVPVCLFIAENGGLGEAAQKYCDVSQSPLHVHHIKGASHSFPEREATEEIAEKITGFIRQSGGIA